MDNILETVRIEAGVGCRNNPLAEQNQRAGFGYVFWPLANMQKHFLLFPHRKLRLRLRACPWRQARPSEYHFKDSISGEKPGYPGGNPGWFQIYFASIGWRKQ
jgi:hypothetical protein